MSRMSRFDRPVPIRPVKISRQQFMAKLRREVKRRLLADGLIVDPATAPPKYEFHWLLGSRFGIVRANTSGEARGLIKKELGIKGRLPEEIDIQRVEPNADQRNGDEPPAGSTAPA